MSNWVADYNEWIDSLEPRAQEIARKWYDMTGADINSCDQSLVCIDIWKKSESYEDFKKLYMLLMSTEGRSVVYDLEDDMRFAWDLMMHMYHDTTVRIAEHIKNQSVYNMKKEK